MATVKNKTKRISVRLTESLANHLEEILKSSDENISSVITKALDLYIKSGEFKQQRVFDVVESSGFIGCASGSRSLSENYKNILGKSLKKKHAYR